MEMFLIWFWDFKLSWSTFISEIQLVSYIFITKKDFFFKLYNEALELLFFYIFRALEIVFAYIAESLIFSILPSILSVIGAGIVVLSKYFYFEAKLFFSFFLL